MSAEGESTNSPVAAGEILAGKYRVDRVIGQGGMGIVVAATHEQLRQRVAIKFLLKGARGDVVTRFLREARAAAKLRSEHVARVLDVGELPTGSPFMVMEFLEGSDLEGTLAQRGPLPIDEAILHVLQACEAIAEAHAAGIVHRDLKPANLFLAKTPDGSGTIKVLDFGISKDANEDTGEPSASLTRTTAVLGSPSYMAPEQMRSTRDADTRADIWSLGIILYELVTGTVPFDAESFVELAMKVISEEPTPPGQLRPDLPAEVEAAILRCIQKNPAHRFANVAELAAAIAPFGSALSISYSERIARVQGHTPRSAESSLPIVPMPSGPTQLLGGKSSQFGGSGPGKTQMGTGTISAAGWAGPPDQPTGRRSRATLLVVGGLVGGVAVLGGAAFALRGEEPSAPAPASASPTAVEVTQARVVQEPPTVAPPTGGPLLADAGPDALDEPPEDAATTPSAAPSAIAPASANEAKARTPAPRAPAAPRPSAKPQPPAPPPKPAVVEPPAAPKPKHPLDIDIQ